MIALLQPGLRTGIRVFWSDPDPVFIMRSDPDPIFKISSDPVTKFGSGFDTHE